MDTSISAGPDIEAGSDIEVWYTRYAPRLRRAARRIVGNEHDAEDATQDAFLAAFRARHRYRTDSDPYPWLFRIATRKALTIAAGQRTLADYRAALVAGTAPSAEDELLARDSARALARVVATELPVALHLVDGLRFRDISQRLGIPPATAATRVRRGKQRIRAVLAATFAPEATPYDNRRSRTA